MIARAERCHAFLIVLPLILLTHAPLPAQSPVITTIAGGGPDGVPALSVNLGGAADFALDGAGNLYIVSQRDHKLYKVDTTGILTQVAGTGIERPLGDGGPASRASFLLPSSVAVGPGGEILVHEGAEVEYCCEPYPVFVRVSGRLRLIQPGSGLIDTVGVMSVAGDLVFVQPGRIFVSVWRFPPYSYDMFGQVFSLDPITHLVGPVAATSAPFGGPLDDGAQATEVSLGRRLGMAMQGGDRLLVSDDEHLRIRSIDLPTNRIDTYAGNGVAGYTGDGGPALGASIEPGSLATDAAGSLYILGSSRLRRVDVSTGIITTVAGTGTPGTGGDGGPAVDASVTSGEVEVDATGNIYLLSSGKVRRIDAVTGIIDSVAGSTQADFFGDGGAATQARMRNPVDLAVSAAGDLYIGDAGLKAIWKVEKNGGTFRKLMVLGNHETGGRSNPRQLTSIALHPSGDIYYSLKVTFDDFFGYAGEDSVWRLDPDTGERTLVVGQGYPGYTGDGGPAGEATVHQPMALAFDASGNLFIADSGNHVIRRVDAATGLIETFAGGGPPGGLGDGGPARLATLVRPGGLAIDARGDLWIADLDQHRVRRVDSLTGVIETVAGNGSSGSTGDGGSATEASLTPRRIALDPAGNLYVSGDERVRKVDAVSGIIRTVAGDGSFGFYGDGGPALLAGLAGPEGVAVDPATGRLLIASYEAGRVRAVPLPLQPGIALDVTPSALWPPAHHMIEVRAAVTPRPGFVPAHVILDSISSSEPDDAPGSTDGITGPDIQDADIGSEDFVFRLRAERDGNGPGRIYSITYQAFDAAGNGAAATAEVVVPHDRSGVDDPVSIALTETAGGTLVAWDAIPGAPTCDVVRGALQNLVQTGSTVHLGPVACIEPRSADTSTLGREDPLVPAPGTVLFYLAACDDGGRVMIYGSASASMERALAADVCR